MTPVALALAALPADGADPIGQQQLQKPHCSGRHTQHTCRPQIDSTLSRRTGYVTITITFHNLMLCESAVQLTNQDQIVVGSFYRFE
jgi:hypothetical protein